MEEENYLEMSPIDAPIWIWGIIFGIIFFLFVIAIYYASKTNVHGSNPFVSAKQYIASGGIMNTPGAY